MATSTNTTDDPFLLHWGTSVDVNDDLRRSIRTEIESIEKSTSLLSTNVRNEERTANQLTKDILRAKSEMMDFRRGGADYAEGAMVNEEVLGRLTEEFGGEVGVHVVRRVVSPDGSNSNSAITGGDEDGEDADEDGGVDGGDGTDGILDSNDGIVGGGANNANGANSMEDGISTPPHTNPSNNTNNGKRTPTYSHSKFLTQKRHQTAQKRSSIQTLHREILHTRKQISTTNDETSNILGIIQSRQLESTKLAGERQVDGRRRELESECMRNRGVKEMIQVARANSGGFAQKIAEKAKEQIAERSNNVSTESSLSSTIDTKQQELALLANQEKKLDAELATLSGQLDYLIRQLTDAESEVKKSNSIQSEMEVVQKDVDEAKMIHQEASKKAQTSEKNLEETTALLDRATKNAQLLQETKRGNDRAQLEILIPAQERKSHATKEKETLAGEIANLHKSIMDMEEEYRTHSSGREVKLSTLNNDLQSHKTILEKNRTDLETLEKTFEEEEISRGKELEQHKSFSTQFENATQAEIARLHTLKKERIDRRVERLEKRRSELAALEDGRNRSLEFLRRGLEVVQEMRGVEESLRSVEVVIGEDGEEVVNGDGGEGKMPEEVVTFLNENADVMEEIEALGESVGGDDAVVADCGEDDEMRDQCAGEYCEEDKMETEVADDSHANDQGDVENEAGIMDGWNEDDNDDDNDDQASVGGKHSDRDDMVTEAASPPAAKRR